MLADATPLIWKTTGLGEGYTAPSIVSGRVFGSGYQAEDEVISGGRLYLRDMDALFCYDLKKK